MHRIKLAVYFIFRPLKHSQTTLGQEGMYARLLPSLTIEVLIAVIGSSKPLGGSMQWWVAQDKVNKEYLVYQEARDLSLEEPILLCIAMD